MEIKISEEDMAAYTEFSDLVDRVTRLGEEEQAAQVGRWLLAQKKSPQPPDGRRRRPRVPCRMIAEFRSGTGTRKGIVADISEDGLFMETAAVPAGGREITLSAGRSGGRTPLCFPCEVVRTGAKGFGAMFGKRNFYTDFLIGSVLERLTKRQPGK